MKNKCKTLILYFTVISLLEIAAYAFGGVFSIAASWIWLITGILLVINIVYEMCSMLYDNFKKGKYFLSVAFIFLIFIFFWFIGNVNWADINPDAAQQVAAGLDSFNVKDLNYTKNAFLNLYPNRQFVIIAIPSLLFGRNIWTLHAGFGIMFLLGLTTLFFELVKFMQKKSLREEYALIPCFSLLTFRYIIEFFLNFEQAIVPVSLSMLSIAFYLKLIRDPSLKNFVFLSWIGCFLTRSYTPSLALMGLLIVFLIIYFFECNLKKNKILKKMPNLKKFFENKLFVLDNNYRSNEMVNLGIILLILNMIVFFLVSIIFGSGSRFMFDFRGPIIPAIIASWINFFTDSNAVFWGLFLFIIIFYMINSLLFKFKINDFIIVIWALGVVVFADYMVGYTNYDEQWILQRDMLIIPVLMVAIFITIMRYVKKFEIVISNFNITIILLVFTLFGVYNFSQNHQSFVYFNHIVPAKYMISYIEDTLKENSINTNDEFALLVFTSNELMLNVDDYAKFFFPNATIRYSFAKNEDEIANFSKILIFSEEEFDLHHNVMSNSVLHDRIISGKLDYKEYYDKRHNVDVYWFRNVIISD